MERTPQPPGGEQQPANGYDTDDAAVQAEQAGPDPDSPAAHEAAVSGERRRYHPLVYVADTTSQEQGLQHGQWLNAARTADELRTDIVAMLARSPVPHSASWEVQASTGFAGLDLPKSADVVLISELGRGVSRHGAAYAAWVGIVGTQDREHLARFNDFYIGSYDDLEAWGRSLGEGFEWNAQLDEVVDPLLRPHLRIDYAAVAHAARESWDVLFGHDGKIHVFLR